LIFIGILRIIGFKDLRIRFKFEIYLIKIKILFFNKDHSRRF